MNRFLPIAFLSLVPALTLQAVPPLIADVADQVIVQNSATGTIPFVVGDTETTFSALTVAVVSGNTTLVPQNPANLSLSGTNSQRTIAVTPAAGQTGTTVITLTVTDAEDLTASSSFQVTVTTPNTPPAISGIPLYQMVAPGEIPAGINFTVTDAETATPAVIAISSNTSLVPNENISVSGSGSNRSIQITPVSGRRGAAVIRVRTTDAAGSSAQKEFLFSVFEPSSANNGFKQPRGLYVLDSGAGSQIGGASMRDANVRNLPFLDGYVLRTE